MSAGSQRKRAARLRAQQSAEAAKQNRHLHVDGGSGEDPTEWPTSALAVLQWQELWQGPIPGTDDFALYKQVDPDLPNRIMGIAEWQLQLAKTQQEHRLELERAAVRGARFRANLALFMAFGLAAGVLGGSFWVIDSGHDAAGIAIAGFDLLSLVSVFIYGRHDQARRNGPMRVSRGADARLGDGTRGTAGRHRERREP